LWEIYSWQEGGHANLIYSGEPEGKEKQADDHPCR
jgi:hypothetical protein